MGSRRTTTNNNILVSEAHHAWLKDEAARRGCTMRDVLEDLIHVGRGIDRDPPPLHATRQERIEHVRRTFARGGKDA